MIADYFLVRRRELHVDDLYRRGGEYEYRNGVNPRAVVSLAAGIFVALIGLVVPPLGWLYRLRLVRRASLVSRRRVYVRPDAARRWRCTPESNGLAEQLPAADAHEALVEANRCLFCFDAPARTPARRTSISRASSRRSRPTTCIGSARTILDANLLGATCARVCPCRNSAKAPACWAPNTSPS